MGKLLPARPRRMLPGQSRLSTWVSKRQWSLQGHRRRRSRRPKQRMRPQRLRGRRLRRWRLQTRRQECRQTVRRWRPLHRATAGRRLPTWFVPSPAMSWWTLCARVTGDATSARPRRWAGRPPARAPVLAPGGGCMTRRPWGSVPGLAATSLAWSGRGDAPPTPSCCTLPGVAAAGQPRLPRWRRLHHEPQAGGGAGRARALRRVAGGPTARHRRWCVSEACPSQLSSSPGGGTRLYAAMFASPLFLPGAKNVQGPRSSCARVGRGCAGERGLHAAPRPGFGAGRNRTAMISRGRGYRDNRLNGHIIRGVPDILQPPITSIQPPWRRTRTKSPRWTAY